MKKTDAKSVFAAAVRAYRNGLGLSQEQLAERASLHRTYISDVERAARNLSLESISRLADALEVSIAALFEHSQPPEGLARHKAGQNYDDRFVDILLVEDDVSDVELTLHAFRRSRFANRIHVATDGEEALDFVLCRGAYARRSEENRPKIILLDLNLPRVSGLEVLRRIKADGTSRQIPVVVLTASQCESDMEESKRLGAAAYIQKPVDLQRLIRVTPQLSLNWALLRPIEAVA